MPYDPSAGQFVGYQPTPSPRALDPVAQAALRNLRQVIPVDPMDPSKGDIVVNGADRELTAENMDTLRSQYANQATNYNLNPPAPKGTGFVRNDTTGATASLADLPARKAAPFSVRYAAVQPSLQVADEQAAKNRQIAADDAEFTAKEARYGKSIAGQADAAKLQAFKDAIAEGQRLQAERRALKEKRTGMLDKAINPAPYQPQGPMQDGSSIPPVARTGVDRDALNSIRFMDWAENGGAMPNPEFEDMNMDLLRTDLANKKREAADYQTNKERTSQAALDKIAEFQSQTDPDAANKLMMLNHPELADRIKGIGQGSAVPSFFQPSVPDASVLGDITGRKLSEMVTNDTPMLERLATQVPAQGLTGAVAGSFAPGVGTLVGGGVGIGTGILSSIFGYGKKPTAEGMAQLKPVYGQLVQSLTRANRGDKATAIQLANNQITDLAKKAGWSTKDTRT